MTTRTSTIEDLESGKDKEFERIKQNFAPSPNRNTQGNLGETHLALQGLQSELQEFLAQYIAKISSFQEDIARGLANNNEVPDTQRNTPALSPRDSQLSNGDSHNAMEDDRPGPEQRQSKPPVTSSDKALADVHMRSLQAFLVAHVENIRRLQDSSQAPSMIHAKENLSVAHSEGPNIVQEPDLNTKAQLNIVTSTVMAILIVLFLLLVISIIGSKHRTPYSVTMFFAFLALSPLFVAVFVAKLVPTQPQSNPEELNFYLHICEQLQLVAVGFFVISIIIATFFIFVSLAFPFVILALSGIAALVIFMSVHWEVAITLDNILYLLKNIRRLGMVVDFVKYNRKVLPTPDILL